MKKTNDFIQNKTREIGKCVATSTALKASVNSTIKKLEEENTAIDRIQNEISNYIENLITMRDELDFTYADNKAIMHKLENIFKVN